MRQYEDTYFSAQCQCSHRRPQILNSRTTASKQPNNPNRIHRIIQRTLIGFIVRIKRPRRLSSRLVTLTPHLVRRHRSNPSCWAKITHQESSPRPVQLSKHSHNTATTSSRTTTQTAAVAVHRVVVLVMPSIHHAILKSHVKNRIVSSRSVHRWERRRGLVAARQFVNTWSVHWMDVRLTLLPFVFAWTTRRLRG